MTCNSITFVIEGVTDTQVTITEQEDGTLLFELETLDSGPLGDLRGIFFDLAGVSDDFISSLEVELTGDVTDYAAAADEVTSVGNGVNVNGPVAAASDGFDVGVAFGTPGKGQDEVTSTSFVLSSSEGDLSIEMVSLVDMALRYTSVEGSGENGGSKKIGGQSSEAIIAEDDAFAVDEDASNSTDVFSNDDPNSGVTLVGGSYAGGDLVIGANNVLTTDGRAGILTLNANGTVDFDATGSDFDSLAVGESDTLIFEYHSMAANGSTACAEVTVTVNGVNDPPVAVDDAAEAYEDGFGVLIPVLANDFDVDSDDDSTTLTVISATAASGATVNVSGIAGAAIGYLPSSVDFDYLDEGDTYIDTITYMIQDSHGATDVGAVKVTVHGVNDAPVANDDFSAVGEDGPAIIISVFDNDFDPDADDPLVIDSIDTTGTLGAVSLLDLNGNISYDPDGQFTALNDGESATDTFTYTLIDSQGVTSTATVSVTVFGRDDIPVERVIDPDDAPAETPLEDFFAGVELTIRDGSNGALILEDVVSRFDDDTSTGDYVFARADEPDSEWDGYFGIFDNDVLRVAFDNPVTEVSIDFISPDDVPAFYAPNLNQGYMAIYDSDGNMLDSASTSSGDLDEKGEIATLSLASLTGDIAYAEFEGFGALGWSGALNLDNITFTELT